MALFDKEGCLLNLFGGAAIRVRLEQNGIGTGSIWRMDTIGPNAVTVGLCEKKALHSIRTENFHPHLWSQSLYFTPIQMNDYYNPSKKLDFGGIAICVPETEERGEYAMLAHAIAYETIMNMHFGQAANALYTIAELREIFASIDMALGEYRGSADLLTDLQAWDNQFLDKMTNYDGREIIIPTFPIKHDEEEPRKRLAADVAGGSTAAILTEAG